MDRKQMLGLQRNIPDTSVIEEEIIKLLHQFDHEDSVSGAPGSGFPPKMKQIAKSIQTGDVELDCIGQLAVCLGFAYVFRVLVKPDFETDGIDGLMT